MKLLTVAVLLGVCACHKKDALLADNNSMQTTPIDTTTGALSAPSETVGAGVVPVASGSASAAPLASGSAAPSGSVSFGMIGLLAGDASAPWGRDDSARGNMWGDAVGDSFGAGGLGLSGSADGGGGRGEGIGLGNIGTLGHGSGTGSGGFGSGHGRLTGSHGNAIVRQGTTTVNGRLPPEVIQRIVRQNFGRFRLCYHNGLVGDPKLTGTIATKFVIDRQGNVTSSARDPGTTLSDAVVVSCVVNAFKNLSFPQPEGGIVTVIYPLIFEPGDTP